MSMNPSFVSSSNCYFSVVWDMNINAEDAGTINYHRHRELLFEKALTPSDVGKLNRLVIPKQYVEKYFPLRSACGRSSSSGSFAGESLLSFEDEMGKAWRFRYSYWTSSQSYVLTKGWSRYVKEKGLTAGDIVSFKRQQCNSDDHTGRLFISWRTHAPTGTVQRIKFSNAGHYLGRTTAIFPAPQPYRPLHHPTMNLSHKYTGRENQMVPISGTPRRLRLFGVNMELTEPDQSSNVCSDVLTLSHGGSALIS